MEAVLKVPSGKIDGILQIHSVCVGTLVKDNDPSVLFPCMHISTFLWITAEKKLIYYYTLHIASDTF